MMSEQEMIRQAKNAYHRNFYAKNHDKMVKYQREYRAKKGRPGKWTDAKKVVPHTHRTVYEMDTVNEFELYESEKVLCSDRNGIVSVGVFYKDKFRGESYWITETNDHEENVLFWMPIPKIPGDNK